MRGENGAGIARGGCRGWRYCWAGIVGGRYRNVNRWFDRRVVWEAISGLLLSSMEVSPRNAIARDAGGSLLRDPGEYAHLKVWLGCGELSCYK